MDSTTQTWRCPYFCGWYRRYSRDYTTAAHDIRTHDCDTYEAAIKRLTQVALLHGWLDYEGDDRTQPSWLVKR